MEENSNILLETGTNELEIIEFILNFLDDENVMQVQSYGINVAKVREIIRMPNLTKVPNMPEGVYGVFNLRNNLISALDLSKYLYNYENNDPNRKMIITEFNGVHCGFIVTDVQRIHRISWNQIESPDVIHDFNEENNSIIGVVKLGDNNILMVDIERILAYIDPSSAMDKVQFRKGMDWKPKAVTAEDSSTIRRMVTQKLTSAGFDIHSFNNGVDAWDYLKTISSKVAAGEDITKYIDVLITDIEMPKMDGYSLIKEFKRDPVFSKIPAVIFSSIISSDVRHKGKAVGADAQLSKPQIGELIHIVQSLLEKNSNQ